MGAGDGVFRRDIFAMFGLRGTRLSVSRDALAPSSDVNVAPGEQLMDVQVAQVVVDVPVVEQNRTAIFAQRSRVDRQNNTEDLWLAHGLAAAVQRLSLAQIPVPLSSSADDDSGRWQLIDGFEGVKFRPWRMCRNCTASDYCPRV